jgi:hypothetical protein
MSHNYNYRFYYKYNRPVELHIEVLDTWLQLDTLLLEDMVPGYTEPACKNILLLKLAQHWLALLLTLGQHTHQMVLVVVQIIRPAIFADR